MLAKIRGNRIVSLMLNVLLTCNIVGFVLLLPTVSAEAGGTSLNPLVTGTALDDGPQDGTFDSFVLSPNHGMLNNNGWGDYRVAFEFDLSEISSFSTIDSATLSVTIANYEGTRSVELHGYSGDGVIQLGDFSRNGLLGSESISAGGNTLLEFDVSNFLTNLVNEGQAYAGFNIRESPANTPNYLIMVVTRVRYPSNTNSLLQLSIQTDDQCPGSVVTVNAGETLVIPSGCSVDLLNNHGTVLNRGAVWELRNNNAGYFDNEGSVDNYLENSFNGHVNNDGFIGGTFYNYGTFDNGYTFGISGNFNNYGTANNFGDVFATVRNMANATFTNIGSVDGYIYNNANANLISSGTIRGLNNLHGATFTNSGNVDWVVMNWGTVESSGTIWNVYNWQDASFTNNGEANFFWNYGTLTNLGSISNYLVNYSNAFVDNFGRIAVLNNYGIVDNHCSATIEIYEWNDGIVNELCLMDTIEALIQYTEDLNAHHGIENSLDVKLDKVLKVLENVNQNNYGVAINVLNAFINEVEAQRDVKIPADDANQMIDMAYDILDMLSQ